MNPLPEYLAIVRGQDGFYIQGTFEMLKGNKVRKGLVQYWQAEPVQAWIGREFIHCAKRFSSHTEAHEYANENADNLDPAMNESVA